MKVSSFVVLMSAGIAAACSSSTSSGSHTDAGTLAPDASGPRVTDDANDAANAANAANAVNADAGAHSSSGNEAGVVGPSSDGGPCMPGAASTTSGVAPAKAVEDFSDGDRQAFCAWAAQLYGGYGCDTTCSSGIERSFSANLADCKVQFTRPGCKATAKELEACTSKDAEDVCQLAIFDAAECAAWTQCMRL